MSTPKRLQTHWAQAAAFIKKEWPLFSETALKDINGDYTKFLAYLKDYTNDFPLAEAKARDRLQRFFNSLE